MYLIRFDDICPTLNWGVWNRLETELTQRGISPLLAVVPDNRDPTLMVNPPAADFWERMRQCQARGWTMALHGYQHLYVTRNAGLVGRRKKSEFAGLPADQQDEKLRRGIEILRGEGLEPKVWIAPGHTFDATTVSLLKKHGIQVISDGLFRYPRRAGDGMLWIPSQIHSFEHVPQGVWTVCCHINPWRDAEVDLFCRDLDRYHERILSFEEVVERYGNRKGRWTERVYLNANWSYYLLRVRIMLQAYYETHLSHR